MTIRRYFYVLATLLALVCISPAVHAATISVNTNFSNNNNLLPAEAAGVVSAPNWTNVFVSGGPNAGAGPEATAASLLDDSGAATGVNFRIHGSGPNGVDNVVGVGPNEEMMRDGVRTILGHGGDASRGQLEFTNLLGSFSSYDVYVYIGEGHSLMGSRGKIYYGGDSYTNDNGADTPAHSFVEYMTGLSASGETYYPPYTESTGLLVPGNYVKISGLSLDTLVLTMAPNTGGSNDGGGGFFDTVTVLGVQIDGVPVPEPSSFALAGLGLVGLIGFAVRRRKK